MLSLPFSLSNRNWFRTWCNFVTTLGDTRHVLAITDIQCPCHKVQHALLPRLEGHVCGSLCEALEILGYAWPATWNSRSRFLPFPDDVVNDIVEQIGLVDIELGFKRKITDYAGFSTCVHSLLARYSDTPSLREAYSFKHCLGDFVCAPVDCG